MKSFFEIDDEFKNPFFVATVEDNADPTFNYRVKVRIENLHPETITTEQLPWAGRVDTAFMGMGEDNDINHSVPEVGTQVLVLAVGSNVNSLLYLGCLYRKHTNTPATDAYTGTYGIYRKDGQFIGIDKVQSLFQMLFAGDISIDQVQNATINVTSAVTIQCTNANVAASGSVLLDTPAVTMTGDLAVSGSVVVTGTVTAADNISGAISGLSHTHTGNLGAPTSTPQ